MLFVPEAGVLFSFALATFIIALSPGPDMALFLERTLSQGVSAGHAALLGAMSGLVVHTLLVAYGISALLTASQTAFSILKIAGAVYLLWLAVQAVRGSSTLNIARHKTRQLSFFRNWLTGISINLLNPKIVVFFITFLPQFVGGDDPDAFGKLLFLGGLFIAIGSVVCLGIIGFANRFVRALTKHQRVARILDYSFAAIFSAFALKILTAQRL